MVVGFQMNGFEYPPGATPLDGDDMDGLRLPHIANRTELDRWEQENILAAEDWVWARRKKDPFDDVFLRTLHEKMFGRVWKWAGKFRTSDKNLGVSHWEVAVQVRNLCEDARVWIDSGVYPPDEIAARLHHRLVFIHPFANGNGRHARLWADLILVQVFRQSRFSWGGGDSLQTGSARVRYLEALRAADNRDYGPLMRFVRS